MLRCDPNLDAPGICFIIDHLSWGSKEAPMANEDLIGSVSSERTSTVLTRGRLLERAAVAGAALALPGAFSEAAAAALAARPKRGGRLRIADPGAGNVETLDPQKSIYLIDEMRDRQLYDTLTFFTPKYELRGWLAQSIEPNANATRWQIKLRRGVTFHNGKTLTADDVLWTWRRILDPKTASGGAAQIFALDLKRTKKVGPYEILAVLKQPQVDFPYLLSGREQSIIPAGFSKFAKPIGTGPFQFVSFTPGRQSLFKRNPNYWQDGQPYVDELQILTIADNAARLNALLGGQVDAIDNLPFVNARTLKGNRKARVLVTATPTCLPWVMLLDRKPFNDLRVRDAIKYAVDREKTVNVALQGFGQVGNDLFGLGTPSYNRRIQQRIYDPERAKRLLQAAGVDRLAITLHTNPGTVGNVESCQALREQAKAAGIDVAVKVWDSAKFGSDIYLKVPFFQSYWNFPPEIMFPFAFLKKSLYNETHFADPAFARLYAKAEATVDKTKRQKLFDDLQEIIWKRGGYVIWGFFNFTDAISPRVRGVVPHAYFNLGAFQFRTWWLA
jgi:peptide/nickel transport system substrate-binding protein